MESSHRELQNQAFVVDLLKQVLPLEYAFVRYYKLMLPGLNKEIVPKVTQLISESIEHTKVTVEILQSLGAVVTINDSQTPQVRSTIDTFKMQLERERLARWLFLRAAEVIEGEAVRQKFLTMASQEESHIAVVESILAHPEQFGPEQFV